MERKISSTTTATESRDLFRPEELAQLTADTGRIVRAITGRKLMERHLSALSGAIGLLRKPDFPSLRVL